MKITVYKKLRGLQSIINKFGDNKEDWSKYVFSKPESLTADSLTRIHAESLTNPLSAKHAFCWVVKSNLEMDFPNEETLLSYDTDLLEEDDKFYPTTEVENLQIHTDSNTLQVNTISAETSDYRNRIKISEFDPEKGSVTLFQ